MKIVRTALSLLLILCLVLPMVPVSAAQISDTATAAPVGAEKTAPQLRLDADCQLLRYVDEADFLSRGHIARFETEETLSSYVFLNPDGSKTVYFLDEPVKFQIGDGRVWEKDLTLTAVAGGYDTTRNDVGLTLPTDPADGILLTYGGQQISLVPQGGVAAGEPEVTDNAVTYPDCFGTGISLRCTPTYSGLRAEPAAGAAVGSVSFTLNTGGLALCRSDNGWYLAGPDQSRIELGQATAVQVLEPSQSYRLTYPAATGLVLTVSQDGESLSADQRIFRQLRGSNAFREKDPEEITSVEFFTHSRSDRVDMTQTVKGWKSGTAETSAALTAASLTAESGTEDAAYAVMTYSNTIWFAYDFLDVASGKSGTASVSTNYAGDVTWASSDETIATVSKTGTYTATVTGVKSGIATITATLSNGESATFTLYVTITNGIYFIGHSSLYIGVDGGMLENSEVKLWEKKSGGPAQLRQLWKIQHVERDYYSIRSAYRHDLALFADGTNNIKMATLDTALTPEETPLNLQWRISRDVNSFVIQYVGTSSLTLRPAEDTLSPGTDLTVANVTPTNSYTWTLGWKTVEDQLLLLNTQLGLPAQNAVRTVAYGGAADLASMNLTTSFVSRTTNDQTVQWTSQYPWIAEVDSAGNITAKSVGSTIITASVGDDVNTVSYTVTVTAPAGVDVVNLDVIYDYGFVEIFPDYMARMGPQLAAMQRFYLDEYGLLVNYSNPSLFRSYVDECPNYVLDEYVHFCGLCTCSSDSCENSEIYTDGTAMLKELHHTNYMNILARIPFPDMSETLRLAYIGRDICIFEWGMCVTTPVRGVAIGDLGVAMVTSNDAIEKAISTTIHEIGHLFGIGDHYGKESDSDDEEDMPSTEEKNAMSDGLYSQECIYGEKRMAQADNGIYELCDGCKRDMEACIEEFLDKWGD